MNFNWNQAGMPATLVSRLGRRELTDYGRGDLVEMVRELTTSLANAERELESANRRYERLTADLARRGIRIEESNGKDEAPKETPPPREPKSILEGMDEWEEWDRRFRSLLG